MDVVVTIPKSQWSKWLAEGTLPGEAAPKDVDYLVRVHNRPRIEPGERVYVVSYGRLRGYAPLVKILDWIAPLDELDDTVASWYDQHRDGVHYYLARKGGAVAVTIPQPVTGFQGWRYRWWERGDELPFPDWKFEGVTK